MCKIFVKIQKKIIFLYEKFKNEKMKRKKKKILEIDKKILLKNNKKQEEYGENTKYNENTKGVKH